MSVPIAIGSFGVPLLITLLSASLQAQEVVFPDPGLKSAIWGALGRTLPVGTVTEEDMLNLTNLVARSVGVKSLEGLGTARNLASLDLCCNDLTTLSLPIGLTNLIALDVSRNRLTDFSFLGNLDSLHTLYYETCSTFQPADEPSPA